MTRGGLLIGLVVSALATAAHAELFRCTGPDGKTIFTDQKKVCPGAEASEPAGVVQRIETPKAPERDDPGAPAALPSDPNAEDTEAAEAAAWRQKKRDAEQQVAKISAEIDAIDRVAGHCKRPGNYVVTRDDAGIKQVANCSELMRHFDDLQRQEAAAREYLATGLAEDCRRAGCLPGWVR